MSFKDSCGIYTLQTIIADYHNYFFWEGIIHFIWYVRIICQTTNLFYPLLGTPTCAYQGGSNVSFSENFAYVLNDS